MTSPGRERFLRIPVLGPLARWLLVIVRLPSLLAHLTGRIDEVARSVDSIRTRMDEVERLMRGDLGPGAGRPLDIAALRNQLESVPLELSALRRDLARLEASG